MGRKSTPTMRDVARLADVSVATVSAVINGTAVVSPHRAKNVRKAMETLDYHADQIARSLRTGKTRVIGMVIPDVTNSFYPEVIMGAEEAAGLANYSVILCNANEDPAQEQRQLATLFSHRIDGLLIACSDPEIAIDSLLRRRFPIVCFDRIPAGFRGDVASTDNLAGGYLATRHLIDLGHKRIAVLAGRTQLSTHSGRLEGFRKAMQEAELPVRQEYCLTGGLQAEIGYEFGHSILRLAEPPTGVFVAIIRCCSVLCALWQPTVFVARSESALLASTILPGRKTSTLHSPPSRSRRVNWAVKPCSYCFAGSTQIRKIS